MTIFVPGRQTYVEKSEAFTTPDGTLHILVDVIQTVLSPRVASSPESGPLGACHMRCCERFEEDDNAVNWSSLAAGGYLHWRCRR